MKRLIYITMLMVVLTLIIGCRTTKSIETVREVYKTRTDTVRDSIYRDVFRNVWTKGDTVHEQTTEYIYKDRWRTHTDTLVRQDTVAQIVTVREAATTTWWEEFKSKTWSMLLAALMSSLICMVIMFRKKWL